MKNKIILLLLCLIVTLPMQGCSSQNKKANTKDVNVGEKSETQKITQKKELNFKTYKEITEFGKKKTSVFADILKKNNIENIISPDNMYSVNTTNTYNKYDKAYRYYYAYNVMPNFNTGVGSGVITLYNQKNISEAYSKDNNQIKLMCDVINEMTGIKKISIDDFVSQLNNYDNNAKLDTNNKTEVYLGEGQKVSLVFDYTESEVGSAMNITQLIIKYVEPFKNYVDNEPKKYDTVSEFKNEVNKQKKVDEFLIQNGYTNSQLEPVYDKNYINIKTTAGNFNDKFCDEYKISTYFRKYDIENPDNNITLLKPMYSFLKTISEFNYSEKEFSDYINSSLLYNKYYVEMGERVFYSSDKPNNSLSVDSPHYYSLIPNIAPYTSSAANEGLENIELFCNEGFDYRNNQIYIPKDPIYLTIDMCLNVPVVAEGVTQN